MDQTSRIPVLASTLACPGAGQFLQRRWVAGSIFMGTFLLCFFWVMFVALRTIAAYYALASDLDAAPAENPGISGFIAPLIGALVVYILNLGDVVGFKRRIEREKREEAFAHSMVAMMEAMADQKKQPPEIPADETSG